MPRGGIHIQAGPLPMATYCLEQDEGDQLRHKLHLQHPALVFLFLPQWKRQKEEKGENSQPGIHVS